MKASTTLSGSKKAILAVSAIVFWLAVWEVSALILDIRDFFPTVSDILASLISIVLTAQFWATVGMSLIRILAGLILGVIIALITAFFSMIPAVHIFLMPIITVVRSIPVASFIMIVWLLVSEPLIPTLIALLMVFPVVWQNAYDAAVNPPAELDELSVVYGFGRMKRLLYLVVPSVFKGALPGIITASGLAWKAGVAAEIITYTENSIGRNLAIAKNVIEGADLFAWTIIVVLLSLAIEALIKFCSGKAAKIWES